MKKEIKTIDKTKGIVRITTVDERWYARPGKDPETGLPVIDYFPSSTWIAGCYPKGIGFWKWLAEKGWDEAQAIKESRGTSGSKTHQAIDYLEENGKLPIDMVFEDEPLAIEELEAIMGFVRWWDENKPETLAGEMTVFGDGYAGTLDRIYRIGGQIWIVDFKTSQYIWTSMKIQISSYSHADVDIKSLGITQEEWDNRKLAVLQVGYRMNKRRFKFTEIEDRFDLFKISKVIWETENPQAKVQEKDFPLIIKLQKEKDNG